MTFTQTILNIVKDEDLIGLPFSLQQWSTIIEAFDAYTPSLKANILKTTDTLSEVNQRDRISAFLMDVGAGVSYINFNRTPIFDIGRFETYLLRPEDTIRQHRTLKSNVTETIVVDDIVKSATYTQHDNPVEVENAEPIISVATPHNPVTPDTTPHVTSAPTNPTNVASSSQISVSITQDVVDDTVEPTLETAVEAIVKPNVVAPAEPSTIVPDMSVDSVNEDPEPPSTITVVDPDISQPSMATQRSLIIESYENTYSELFEIYYTRFINIISSEIELRKKPLVIRGIPIANCYLHEYSEDMREALVESFMEKHAVEFQRKPELLEQFILQNPDTETYYLNSDQIDTQIDQDLRIIALTVLDDVN